MSDKITLLQTIESAAKRGVIYGMKGDKVNLISVHGEVLLVKDSKGIGFSVHKSKTDYKI